MDLKQNTHIRIVLPTYNEAPRIKASVLKMKEWEASLPEKLKVEWLFVNDGSQDNTLEEIRASLSELKSARVLDLPSNRGKGWACREGILDALTPYDYVFFTDVDLAIPLKHILEFLEHFLQNPQDQMLLGKRNENDQKIHKKSYRNFMSVLFRKWVALRLGMDVSDTQCGFKAFRKDVSRQLFQELRRTRFSFDIEVIVRAYLRGFSLKEVPVSCFNEGPSSVRIFRDSFRMLRELEGIRKEKQHLGSSGF
jgi:dolichyl-phosphate beta-glucosyltransferase